MKQVYGIEATISSFERALWWDTDPDRSQGQEKPSGFGIKIALVIGMVLRPIGPFWKPGFYRGEYGNPWKGGEVAFVLRLPFVAGPFISVALGSWGFYIGLKGYRVNQYKTEYSSWIDKKYVPLGGQEAVYLAPSCSMRRTRWR